MRIIEKDFIIEPETLYLFNLYFLKKDKETGEIKKSKSAYGCSLAGILDRVAKHRVKTKFESENIYLADLLTELIKSENEILKLCKEERPENFDTGD